MFWELSSSDGDEVIYGELRNENVCKNVVIYSFFPSVVKMVLIT